MKQLLLSVVAFAAVMTVNAQQTFNYFDAADVDANGWLWFDSQAKIDKYVGFQTPSSTPKIMLQSATFENGDGEYAEPWADPEQPGCNADGELAGQGAKIGSIVLTPGSKATNDTPDGGGFMLWLPDCAEVSMYISADNFIYAGLLGAKDSWVEPIDCGTVMTYTQVFLRKNYFLKACQGEVVNIQDVANANTGLTWYAEKGNKVTCLFRNNFKSNIYLHGIKVLTYTETASSDPGTSGIDDVDAASSLKLAVSGKTLVANEVADIAVYNLAGVAVAKANAASLDLSDLASGAYVAKAANASGVAVVKLAL